MSSQTSQLLAACAAGDDVGVELAGWRPVLDALRCWPRPVTGEVLAPYAFALGEEDVEQIVAAIRALLADGNRWRPSASEILERLHPPAPVAGVHPGREHPPRPDRLPRTDRFVLRAAAAGEVVCDCWPRPVMWACDRDGVLRCGDCGGLEVGQYENALEQLEEPGA